MEKVRRKPVIKSKMLSGSVLESRAKLDEVKGGIKVFHREEKDNLEETDDEKVNCKVNRKIGGVEARNKRKTWGNTSPHSPFQIANGVSKSVEGVPVLEKRGRSTGIGKKLVRSTDSQVDGGVPKQVSDERSLIICSSDDLGICSESEVVNGIESTEVTEVEDENPEEEREEDGDEGKMDEESEVESKTLAIMGSQEIPDSNGISSPPEESETKKEEITEIAAKLVSDEEGSIRQIGKQETITPENRLEMAVANEEKTIDPMVVSDEERRISQISNQDIIPSGSRRKMVSDEERIVHRIRRKEVVTPGNHLKMVGADEEKNIHGIRKKEILSPEKSLKEVISDEKINNHRSRKQGIKAPEKPLIPNEEKPIHRFRREGAPFSTATPGEARGASIYGTRSRKIPATRGQNKLQNLADLVMWIDVSRSAFVFGVGTFIIISSSYTKTLNVSFISVVSYLGLLYLGAAFLYKSLITKESEVEDNSSYLIGEEDAAWMLRSVIPFLNEFLVKMKALFSGDPATTMKMSVVLFLLAKCGNSITIWKLLKLGFFGVFTLPKCYSSYSAQLTAYGKFWFRRFRDAWDSCTHKKAVALGIFTLVWNLSSMIARVWALFMMFLAVRYYQQTVERDDECGEEDEGACCNFTTAKQKRVL